jgi:predicted negative regulator of RcsB-dependent stress response
LTKCSRTALACLVLATATASCAYYNGLFNANRLAADAKQAEREGRSGEARSLWAQAAVKAESVATRYPGSRYRDDALLLWGRALYEREECRDAVDPLALAVDSSPDPAIQREARLYLGRCHVELRQPDSAIAVVRPLLADSGSALATTALALKGRAELSRGQFAAAVEDLRQVAEEDAAFDLAAAHLGLYQVEEATRVLEARASGDYDDERWLSALDSVGVQDLRLASALVDQLAAKREITSGQRARLLLADGRRWSVGRQPDRAAERFASASEAAPDSAEAAFARAYLAVAELRGTTDLGRLDTLRQTLDASVRRGGNTIPIVSQAAVLVDHAVTALENPEVPGADLAMFVVAEELRDSLDAVAPAVELFLKLQRDHPESIVAPKALLAAAAMQPSRGDSLRHVLQSRYPDSPYTLALAGLGGEQFAALEDSLLTVLAAARERISERGRSRDVGDEVERERE